MSDWLGKVVTAARAGKVADFTSDRRTFESQAGDEPVIAAEDLRGLLLGLRLPSLPEDFDSARCFRWEIKGARITGRLDLRDARLPSGAPLPALEFINCLFEEGLSGDGAHLERLHLSGCSFGTTNINQAEISLKSIRIDNELRFASLKPITADGMLRIDANSAIIGANVVIKHTELNAPANMQVIDPLKTSYAVNFRNAVIRADLLLYPEVAIHGGLMARGIHVGGDVRAFGLVADDGADPKHRRMIRESHGRLRSAMAFDGSHIGGDVWFLTLEEGTTFSVTGSLTMLGIQIGGSLYLTKASLDCGIAEESQDGTISTTGLLGIALSMQGATITGGVSWLNLTDLQSSNTVTDVRGWVVFNQATIGGQVDLAGPFTNIEAIGISVQRDIVIKTMLPVRNKSNGKASMEKGDNAYSWVNLRNASVKGSVQLESVYANQQWRPTGDPEGVTSIAEAHIEGNLSFAGVFDRVETHGTVLGGNLSFYATEGYKAATILYSLILSKASVGGDLNISGLKFFSREFLPAAIKSRLAPPILALVDAEIKHGLRLGSPALALNDSVEFLGARVCQPTCYPELQIVEVRAKRSGPAEPYNRDPSVAYLVRRKRGSALLGGGSSILHQMNGSGEIRLQTREQQRDYLRLFCAYVWGDEGSFRIVEDNDELPPRIEGSADRPLLGPITVESDAKSKDHVFARAFVLYGNHLSEARFKLYLRNVKNIANGNESLSPLGLVEMVEDTPLYEFDRAQLTEYSAPLRFAHKIDESDKDAFATDFRPERGLKEWRELAQDELTIVVPNWSAPFKDDTISLYNAFVDLTDACCGTLEDSDGVAWGPDATLRLENFTYSHIKATGEMIERSSPLWRAGSLVAGWWFRRTNTLDLWSRPLRRKVRPWLLLPKLPLTDLRAEERGAFPQWFANLVNSKIRSTGVNERLRWLEQHVVVSRQVKGTELIETVEPFLQQPYVHLAKVLREQGDEGEARIVEAQRIRIDRWLRAKRSFEGKISLPLFGLFRIFFFYGLKPLRASGTFITCILLGWAAVTFANHSHLMTQTTSTVATTVAPSDPTTPLVPYQQARGESEFYCGSSISNSLYAVDVFIPLLDLRQEGRCDVRALSSRDVGPSTSFRQAKGGLPAKCLAFIHAVVIFPALWQWLKAIYAVLGWVVTSLTILTFSGTLRKWDDSK